MTTIYRYPELGDPKPRPNGQVLLITHDNQHVVGFWNDAHHKAWARRHALARKPHQQPLDLENSK